MRVLRLRAAVAMATAVALSGALVATSASASAASLRVHRRADGASPAVKAIGRYIATFPGGLQSELIITRDTSGSKKNGTYEFTDFSGETGSWTMTGKTIALLAANGGDAGAMFIGSFNGPNIAPGAFGKPGFGYGSWSATPEMTRHRVVTRGASATQSLRTVSARPLAKHAAGTYDAEFPEAGKSDTLVVTNDSLSDQEGTFGLTTTLGDSGNWIVLGKQFAMGITTSTVGDTGIVLIGKLTSAGINTAAKPGVYGIPGGATAHWYAVKE
jgi:hypothetical protein